MSTPPPNPRLPQIGATLFGTFAIAFVAATMVHLGHDGGGLDDPLTVLLYAFSPVPLLVLGAAACLRVTPATYQRWMLGFLVLFLVWAVCGATALVRVDGDESVAVFMHLVVAGMGAITVLVIRGVARQRGLRI